MGLKYPLRKFPSILDNYPVGCLYTQYAVAADNDLDVAMPATGRPATLFGGTWEKLYDSEGTFFCTEGYDYDDAGSANKRASGLMPDQGQKLTGGYTQLAAAIDKTATAKSLFYSVTTGMLSKTLTNTSDKHYLNSAEVIEGSGIGSVVQPRDVVTIDSSTSPNARTSHTTSGRTVPRNRLMRIWRRTA